jgi:hypothetical protein
MIIDASVGEKPMQLPLRRAVLLIAGVSVSAVEMDKDGSGAQRSG